MTDYLLRLRSGAAVRRQVLSCEPDPLVVAGDPGDVGYWFANGEIAASVFARACVQGRGFALVAATNGDFVWLPSAALTRSELGNTEELVQVVAACGSRAAVQWQPATLPDDTDWVQVNAKSDSVYFRRWDRIQEVASGAMYCAPACDVLAKISFESKQCNRRPLVAAPYERVLEALSDDASAVARLFARFMHQPFGDAWSEQTYLAVESLALFAGIPTDVEVPHPESPAQNARYMVTESGDPEQTTRICTLDGDVARDVPRAALRQSRTLEAEGLSFEEPAAIVRDIRKTDELRETDGPLPVERDRRVQHRLDSTRASSGSNAAQTEKLPSGTSVDSVRRTIETSRPRHSALAADERSAELGPANLLSWSSQGVPDRSREKVSQPVLISETIDEAAANATVHDQAHQVTQTSPAVEQPAVRGPARQLSQATRAGASLGGITAAAPVPTPQSIRDTPATIPNATRVVRTGDDPKQLGTAVSNAATAGEANPSSLSRRALAVTVTEAGDTSALLPAAEEVDQPFVTVGKHLVQQPLEIPLLQPHTVSFQTQEETLAKFPGATRPIERGEQAATLHHAALNEAPSRAEHVLGAFYDAQALSAEKARPRVVHEHHDSHSNSEVSPGTLAAVEPLRVKASRTESRPIEPSGAEPARIELRRPGREVIPYAKPVTQGSTTQSMSGATTLAAFTQVASAPAPLTMQSLKSTESGVDLHVRSADVGKALIVSTQQRAPNARQFSASDRQRSHLLFDAARSERFESPAREPSGARSATDTPRALRVISPGIQHRASHLGRGQSAASRTVNVETRVHVGAKRPEFSVARRIEIGEIVVDIGTPEPSVHNVPAPAGSLIAAIPQYRLGVRR